MIKAAKILAVLMVFLSCSVVEIAFAEESAVKGFFKNIKSGFIVQQAESLYQQEKYAESFEKYQNAADQNHARAAYQLHLMYDQGIGTEKNLKKAQEMLEKAVELDDDMAQVALANQLMFAKNSNPEQAIRLLEAAAAKENVLAYIDLAMFYKNGYGVPKDMVKAQEYARLANAQGANVDFLRTAKQAPAEDLKELTTNIQTNLKKLGLYQGTIDGMTGPMTRKAIADFQRSRGLNEDTRIQNEILLQIEEAMK